MSDIPICTETKGPSNHVHSQVLISPLCNHNMCPLPSWLLHQSGHHCFAWCSSYLGRSCKMYPLKVIICEDGNWDNKYMSSSTAASCMARVCNQPTKVPICSHIIQSSDCSGCLEHRKFLCSSIYGATKAEFCRTV